MQEIGAAAIAEDGAIVAPHCAMVIFSAAGDPDQASGRAGAFIGRFHALGRRDSRGKYLTQDNSQSQAIK
jgi:hypothetical protein